MKKLVLVVVIMMLMVPLVTDIAPVELDGLTTFSVGIDDNGRMYYRINSADEIEVVTQDQYDWLFWSSIFFVVLLFVLHLIQSKRINRGATSNQFGFIASKRDIDHIHEELRKLKDLHRILEDKHGNQHYEIRQCMSNITKVRDCLHDGKTFFENPDLEGKKVNVRCEDCGKLMETISLQEYYERKAEEARSGQKQ